jgi:menaquinone-dependent protoporphyrinogen oxidase
VKRLLIVYASKTGTTKDVANSLSKAFPSFCDTYDCRAGIIGHDDCMQKSIESEDIMIQNYEVIILGTAMYMGKPIKEFIHFCNYHQNVLNKKKLILFTCGVATQEEDKKYFWQHMPDSITQEAKLYLHLGGEIREDQMGFFSRMAMKQYIKHHGSVSGVNQDELEKIKVVAKKLLAMRRLDR